jgi:hypothetical protein
MARPKKVKPEVVETPTTEVIPVVEVGAEVVEDAILPKEDVVDTLEAPVEAVEEESTESNTVVTPEEETPPASVQEATEGVEEDDSETPEYFIMSSTGFPIPATLVKIKEMRINDLVDKVLHAAYLGCELCTTNRSTLLNRAPYQTAVLLDTEKLEAFNNGEGKPEYDENTTYLATDVRGKHPSLFLKRVIEIGSKGAFIAPNRKISTGLGFVAPLQTLFPSVSSPSLGVSVNKPTYTVEQIKEMKAPSLKIVCSWYKLPFRGSSQARIDIVKYYKELEA